MREEFKPKKEELLRKAWKKESVKTANLSQAGRRSNT